MKFMPYLYFAFLQSISLYCYALEIEPSLYLMEEKTVKATVSKTDEYKTKITPSDLTTADKKQYIYKAIVYLKNNEKFNVKVTTGNLKTSRVKPHLSDVTEIKIHNRQSKHNGSHVIPSESELKYVVLRPNETAELKLDMRSFIEIKKSKFNYKINDLYNNRFNSWSGSIDSNVIETYK